MSLVEILEVARADQHPHKLWGYAIDVPGPGARSDTYYFEIKGWALGKDHPIQAVLVLDELEQMLARIPLNVPRADVAQHFQHVPHAKQSGFSGTVNVLGTFPEAELSVVALLHDRSRVRLGTIRLRHAAIRSAYPVKFQPLVVNSIGRTGTTWLMRLLCEHERIVAHRVYPYEGRASSYWLHNLLKAHDLQPAHPNQVFEINRQWVDLQMCHNPALAYWFRRTYLEDLAGFAQRSIDQCYSEVARLNGQSLACSDASAPPPEPLYFLEKNGPGYIPTLLWELYPQTREIILVRDFRDMFCSIVSFTEKRGGHKEFGRSGSGEAEFVSNTRARIAGLFKVWQKRKDQAYLLRYEDLILEPEATLGKLLEYLRLRNTPESVAGLIEKSSRDTEHMREHRTSADIKSSVGRWRQELNESQKAMLREHFGTYLEAFGYGLDG